MKFIDKLKSIKIFKKHNYYISKLIHFLNHKERKGSFNFGLFDNYEEAKFAVKDVHYLIQKGTIKTKVSITGDDNQKDKFTLVFEGFVKLKRMNWFLTKMIFVDLYKWISLNFYSLTGAFFTVAILSSLIVVMVVELYRP